MLRSWLNSLRISKNPTIPYELLYELMRKRDSALLSAPENGSSDSGLEYAISDMYTASLSLPCPVHCSLCFLLEIFGLADQLLFFANVLFLLVRSRCIEPDTGSLVVEKTSNFL